MDYQPDVTGSPIAHYTHNPKVFDGFLFYTCASFTCATTTTSPTRSSRPITIDLDDVAVSRDT